jgi:hypothetical protein
MMPKVAKDNLSMASELSLNELAQRVAILHRFRELLVQQRDRFRRYLTVLENQQFHIESGNAEELLFFVEMEEQIISDIFSVQKVIDPLENMVRTDDADVSALKDTLEDLKTQAIARSVHNKDLLSTRMVEIRAEIRSLRNNPFAKASRSLYNHTRTASLVDIKG